MADALFNGDGDLVTITAENSIAKGQIIQLKDGRAGYADNAITAGDPGMVRVSGHATITKATSVVLLNGAEVFWDHSADVGTYKTVNDRDFFAGSCIKDTTATQNIMEIALNVRPTWLIDVARDTFDTVYSGTQGLNTMGIFRRGGAHKFILSTTSEIQKMDIFSRDRFAIASNAIVEYCFTVNSDGAGTNTDVSIGVANGTHATDFESVAEFMVLHLDGNGTSISLDSDDGTVDVGITDTTLDYTEGLAVANRVYGVIDLRDSADIQNYINGALVLGSTVFRLDSATGPLGLIAHIEKASSADVYELDLEFLRVRIAEQ